MKPHLSGGKFILACFLLIKRDLYINIWGSTQSSILLKDQLGSEDFGNVLNDTLVSDNPNL